ncbi:MAG: aromatic ring-hydroxylating dioxygenase subunit alpha [Chitinophagia bacterium]|nr:aromatic ring-hydroxylating dioxygenase subunit alpha [Chitinophagia bacterium]
MDSNIAAKYYFDESVFEAEKEAIFQQCWHFVGLRSQLANNNDFITRNVGGVPVVVQNLKGEVKAFLNVCSHRFSIIQTEPRGNRPMMCPYHGWTYDKDGIPTGIPKKPLFKDFTHDELCELKLREFALEACGDMVFVCVTPPAQTLREYLGDFYADMELMSQGIGAERDVNSMTIGANWKIIVENTLESYHVNLVHMNTFRPLGASGLEFHFSNVHSNWVAGLAIPEDDRKLAKVHAPFEGRPYKIPGYVHYVIFPNLLVSSSYGTSFNLSVIEPLTPGTTKFTSYVYLSKTNGKGEALLGPYGDALVEFNRKVFKEDKDICEEVQKGVAHTHLQGVLSLEEKRVHYFQEKYMEKLQK